MVKSMDECKNCDRVCKFHEHVSKKNDEQDTRIKGVEDLVHDAIPRMQGRMNLLIQIFIAGLILLVSISGFSFLQLLEFKKEYANDKKEGWERTIEQERRYVDLINKLGQKVTKLEGYHDQIYVLPHPEDD